jgi:cell wall-associated NlpC family hydrolase
MMATAQDVIAAAMGMIGTPFHHQGRVPGVGLDCAGVPISIAWALGLVPRTWNVADYGARPDGSTLQALCGQMMTPAPAPVPGGCVLVAWGNGPPQHLGVVVPMPDGTLGMVHAESRRHRAVVLQRLRFGPHMRLVGAYTLPGVH